MSPFDQLTWFLTERSNLRGDTDTLTLPRTIRLPCSKPLDPICTEEYKLVQLILKKRRTKERINELKYSKTIKTIRFFFFNVVTY